MGAIPRCNEEITVSTIAHSVVERVIVGVDTHQDVHVAVAVGADGRHLGELQIETIPTGYEELERWSASFGPVEAFGVEGTGSYGAGLSRFLTSRSHQVFEVNRPDRSTRRRVGKSDSIDAESAARSVFAGTAVGTPKSGDGNVEMIRMLKNTRDSAVKARSQAANQIKALILTSFPELRGSFKGLKASKLRDRCLRLRPGEMTTPVAVAKFSLRSLARRHQRLDDEISELDIELSRLTSATAPALVEAFGMGPNTAATLLVTAGENVERITSEAAFAALCGVSPIPASSGKTTRWRLNRGGNRQANSALHQIAIVRLKSDKRTQDYMKRRIREGKSKLEVIRCLKRYIANEVFRILKKLPQKHR
jgi:transposase